MAFCSKVLEVWGNKAKSEAKEIKDFSFEKGVAMMLSAGGWVDVMVLLV